MESANSPLVLETRTKRQVDPIVWFIPLSNDRGNTEATMILLLVVALIPHAMDPSTRHSITHI